MNEVRMEWLRLARGRAVVRRALAVAAVVGVVLAVINHGDALLSGDISLPRALRMIVTALVPYCVSTYSSVCALRERMDAAGGHVDANNISSRDGWTRSGFRV
jgi:hypothetical protein